MTQYDPYFHQYVQQYFQIQLKCCYSCVMSATLHVIQNFSSAAMLENYKYVISKYHELVLVSDVFCTNVHSFTICQLFAKIASFQSVHC